MPAFFRELLHHRGSYLTWLKDRWRYGQVLHTSKPLPWYLPYTTLSPPPNCPQDTRSN